MALRLLCTRDTYTLWLLWVLTTVHLVVSDVSDEVVIQVTNDGYVSPNENVNVQCLSPSYPLSLLKIELNKDYGPQVVGQGYTSVTFNFQASSFYNGTNFTCKLSLEDDILESITVTIHLSGVFTVTPESISVFIGKDAVFHCSGYGQGLVWLVNNISAIFLEWVSFRVTKLEGQKVANLTISGDHVEHGNTTIICRITYDGTVYQAPLAYLTLLGNVPISSTTIPNFEWPIETSGSVRSMRPQPTESSGNGTLKTPVNEDTQDIVKITIAAIIPPIFVITSVIIFILVLRHKRICPQFQKIVQQSKERMKNCVHYISWTKR